MIRSSWWGWTMSRNVPVDERAVHGTIIPGNGHHRVSGFRHINLLRGNLVEEIGFGSVTRFDSLDAIEAFAGDDHEVSRGSAFVRAARFSFDHKSARFDHGDRIQ